MKWMVFSPMILRLYGYTGQGTTWANEIYFVMNRVPGAGSIARRVDQRSNVIPLYHGCPRNKTTDLDTIKVAVHKKADKLMD